MKEFSANSAAWWQGRFDVINAFFEEGNTQRAKELIDNFRREDPELGGVGINIKFSELEKRYTEMMPKKEG